MQDGSRITRPEQGTLSGLHRQSVRVFRNRVTLTFDLFDLRVNACRTTAMHCMSTDLSADRSSRFSFKARTHTDTQSHATLRIGYRRRE